MTTRARVVAGAGLFGAIGVLFVITRTKSLTYLLEMGVWDVAVIQGALAGALIGNMGWVFMNPSQRLSRTAVVAVMVNFAAWLFFLTTPPVTSPNVGKDPAGGMDVMSGQPVMLAGRANGTHGPENAPDFLLMWTSGPANDFGQMVVMLTFGSDERNWHSWVVAAIGLVVSTAFWVTVGNGIAAWRKKRRLRSTPA